MVVSVWLWGLSAVSKRVVGYARYCCMTTMMFTHTPPPRHNNPIQSPAAAVAYTMSSLGARLTAFINSPTGPKTTHFWGPVANWGFVLAVRVFPLSPTLARRPVA